MTHKDARLSADRRYRYELWRGPKDYPYVLFLCLNPSTADENEDDPTVRRCVGFARTWGYETMALVNLFAMRATDPRELWVAYDPVGGEENQRTIRELAMGADKIVAAWGARRLHQAWLTRIMLERCGVRLWCLGKTKDGHPRHPLYLPKNTALEPMD